MADKFDGCQAICSVIMTGEVDDDIKEPIKDDMNLIKEIYCHMEYFDDQHSSEELHDKQVQQLAMKIYAECEKHYRKYHPKKEVKV